MASHFFSTHAVPAQDRPAYLRERLFRPHLSMDIAPLRDVPLGGFVRSADFGALTIAEINMSSAVLTRDQKQADSVRDDAVFFDLMSFGDLTVRQDGASRVVDRTKCVVSAAKRPYVNELDGGVGGAQMLTVSIPKHFLKRRYAQPGWGLETFDLLSGSAKLLASTVRQANDEVDYLSEEQRRVVGNIIIELIHATSGPEPEVPPHRSAALARVEATLAERFRDADLSAEDVARASGLSSRTMRRLLSDVGTSFTESLQKIRAAEMARQLEHRGRTSATIIDIALASGFNDISTALRAFRANYGQPPSRFRGRL